MALESKSTILSHSEIYWVAKIFDALGSMNLSTISPPVFPSYTQATHLVGILTNFLLNVLQKKKLLTN